MTDQIERDLAAAGFDAMIRENLDDRIEEGSFEDNYEDGQQWRSLKTRGK